MSNPELVYTLAEAADLMRMTRRGIAKLGRRHGLCMVSGRNTTFTASQLAKLQAAITVERAPAVSTATPAPSEYQLRNSLLALTAKRRNKTGGRQHDR